VRVALVSCVKRKRTAPCAAQDLYTSALFVGLRRHAEANADRWYILSAEHGVLLPSQVVAPYERTLTAMPKSARLAWAERVRVQLDALLPAGTEVMLLAGQRYREGIEAQLRARGHAVSVPFEGLRLGEQLQRLAAR
jgi:hypothetical protein